MAGEPHTWSRRAQKVAAASLSAAYRWRSRGPRLGRYAPRSTLELPAHVPHRSCRPAIDFHTHLGRWLTRSGRWMERDVGQLVELMDSCNVAASVNLDGRWGPELEENLDRYDRSHPGRFFTFCHVDWHVLEDRDGPARLARSLRQSVDAGARGLKVWKDLGLKVTVGGRRVLPDDPMLSDIWHTAGELGVPVLVHVADPVAFFQPVDRHNELLEELLRNPRGWRQRGGVEAFRALVDSFERLVASHPQTTFVGAHGCYTENLARVSEMLDDHPNLQIDIGWRAHELGRHPRATRDLFTRHPDRILFGTDVFPARASAYRMYFRLLETADEAFDYSDEPTPPCGRWPLYGLALPRPVLEAVYHQNARRLLGLAAPLGSRDRQLGPAIGR